jgi:hypothetical protein
MTPKHSKKGAGSADLQQIIHQLADTLVKAVGVPGHGASAHGGGGHSGGGSGHGNAAPPPPEVQQVSQLGHQIVQSNQDAAKQSQQIAQQEVKQGEQTQQNFAKSSDSIQKQIVHSNQDAANKSVAAKEDEIKKKSLLEKAYDAVKDAVFKGVEQGAQQCSAIMSSSFSTAVGQIKGGSADLSGVFKSMASQMGKAVIGSIGDSLVQKGAANMTMGTADLIALNPTGAMELVAGGLLSAAGGAVKGLAMAKGGLVTRPTLAYVGEGGQSEAVIPLDRLSKVGIGGGKVSIGTMEAHFPNVQGASGKTGSKPQSAARSFMAVRQVANRRTGSRNA